MQYKNKLNNRLPVQLRKVHWSLLGILCLFLAACSPFAIGGKSTPAPVIHITPTPVHTPGGSTTLSATGSGDPQIVPGDWPSYLLNNGGFNSNESIINQATAPQLTQYWVHHARGAISTQPVVANGMIYWGSWDGYEHATSLDGKKVWATYLGKTTDYNPYCSPQSVGIASTATIAPVKIGGKMTLVDFVGGGNASFYALNATSGHIIWKDSLGSPPAHFIWSSPTIYNGSIYIGMASFGDCPSIQGELIKMSAATGSIQKIFKTVPNGCRGGSIWGSPTIDTSTGELYITTGNPSACATTEIYAVAVIELHASNLAVVGSWQVPASDQFLDSDFGATPALFTGSIHGIMHPLVGAVNKNGIYYAFIRGALDKGPVWHAQIAYVGDCHTCNGPGTIGSGAWDGRWLYLAGGKTTIKEHTCEGSVRALNPGTGHFIWEYCIPDHRVLAAVSVVPGVVFIAEGFYVFAINAATGDPLFTYKDDHNSSRFDGAPTIAHGMLYVGNLDGKLYAFGPGPAA